jgi:hypothetical protein
MNHEKSGFINVEELMAQVPLERALQFYGVEMPAIRQTGDEVRMRCFLACGRHEETGDRAIAIQANHPAKIWRCHESGCGRGGNLVSLCDLMKSGEHAGGKPRGDRFKAILRDLQVMAAGKDTAPEVPPPAEQPAAPLAPVARRGNVPLATSGNERARALVKLDEKFVVDPAAMSPKAASYFRHRPFLIPEVCRKWRVGYLPRDAGGDHVGGTMRGKIVYPFLSEDGEVLTWFGRDPEYDGKVHEWIGGGKQGKEPEKYHFVKGFERGLELFGQQHLREEETVEKLARSGLVVVQGPNDVIALDALGVPAVGLCATTITREQVEKVGRFSAETGHGAVTVMLDCTEAGTLAARVVVVELAQVCPVRLAWSETMHGGSFKGREVTSLTVEEWRRIAGFLGERSPERGET